MVCDKRWLQDFFCKPGWLTMITANRINVWSCHWFLAKNFVTGKVCINFFPRTQGDCLKALWYKRYQILQMSSHLKSFSFTPYWFRLNLSMMGIQWIILHEIWNSNITIPVWNYEWLPTNWVCIIFRVLKDLANKALCNQNKQVCLLRLQFKVIEISLYQKYKCSALVKWAFNS